MPELFLFEMKILFVAIRWLKKIGRVRVTFEENHTILAFWEWGMGN